MTVLEIRPPEEATVFLDHLAQVVNERENQQAQVFRHRRKDGSIIEVNSAIYAISFHGRRAWLVAVNDVTEREHTNRRSLQRLSQLSLLHQIGLGISARQDLQSIFMAALNRLETDLPVAFGCFCLWNEERNTFVVTAIGPQSLPLATVMEMSEQTEIATTPNRLQACMQGEAVYEPEITRLATPLAIEFTRASLHSLVATPLVVEDRILGLLLTGRQAPESFESGDCEFLQQLGAQIALAVHQARLYLQLQHAYAELQLTQQAVLQQERLRALGQMASGIAHDINNAISPAMLYVESLLLSEPDLSTEAQEYLTIVRRTLGDVAQTIARLREFYRNPEANVERLPVNLNEVVQTAVELTRARWRDLSQQHGISITVQLLLEEEVPAVLGTESEIRDALINLIFNALDAMPNGGRLAICTQATPTSVVVKIIDTGIGMDEETRQRCLDPFYTTKGKRGTGLGLAMVYGTLQRHSARIDIASAVGYGTTIRLTFPLPPPSSESTLLQGLGVVVIPSPLKILVVDDDPLLRQALRDILRVDGHEVVVADGGEAGNDAFLAALNGRAFHVVITDLGMPKIDGLELARRVKTQSPTTPVVLLTGWGRQMTSEGEFPPHVDCLLSKPPTIEDLRKTLVFVSAHHEEERIPNGIA